MDWSGRRQGAIIWQHEIPFADDVLLSPQFVPAYYYPQFYSPVLLPDGKILAIGNLPHPPNAISSEIFALCLDIDGNICGRKTIYSNRLNETKIQTLGLGCFAWDRGMVAFGSADKVTRFGSPGVSPISENFYWIGMFDEHGDLERNVFIPDAKIQSASQNELGMVQVGKELILLASDNVNSELLVIDEKGRPLVRRSLEGRFQFVYPLSAEESVHIIGAKIGNDKTTLITLDARLIESGRLEGFPTGTLLPRIWLIACQTDP